MHALYQPSLAWAAALLLGLAALLPGCMRNPATGELQLALIGERQEIEMGREAAAQVTRSIGLVDDPPLQEYLQALGERLAATSERPGLPWTFRVVDDPTPNAFALPGGYIFFTRGILALMSTEAQLAAVLGHEIAHVTARHQVAMISRAQLAQLGLGLGGVLFPDLERLGGIAGLGLELLFLRYGRAAEREADELGFRYALEEGYDVRQMADVFAALQRAGEAHRRSSLPVWLTTHPEPAERIGAVQARVAELEPLPADLRVGRDAYLQRIDGLVYGVNPRNGFFRDGVFQHPELRFRVEFPPAWRHQNLAQSVMAVSPEQDAALQLTLASEDDPTAAAQRFLRPAEVRQLASAARRTINGLPTLIVPFEARTAQGSMLGLAAFISHEGRTFQLIGYTPGGLYARYRSVFERSLGSFAPLTDPRVLAVQPARVRLVQIPERMTLAEFARRYPSEIPVEELALINQVAAPEAELPAGSLVKRVARESPEQ
jgi:predicted Zn-dependent protease